MDQRKKGEALRYHEFPRPGKIAIIPTKKHATQHDLLLVYSLGVAEPCSAIAEDKSNTCKYTTKSNLVAVISNGTAVFGLGGINADASKPVVGGKGLLFKIFTDIDVFDIEVDATDVDEFVEAVKAITPTFGGINLEDIRTPEAFEMERRLKEELDIPVMHDDQHGTTIISATVLIDTLGIVGRDISKVQIVVSGTGTAAISCIRLYVALGADPKNIVMYDSKRVIHKDAPNLIEQKAEFATDRDLRTLEEAVKGSDVFIGLSKGNVLTPEMLLLMNKDVIVFAMTNPTLEIDYDLVVKTRQDIVMTTGRSDYPNQVNNMLRFPYIFCGALDVRATRINEEMELAAVHAIAELTKKPVPQQMSLVCGGENLTFGKNYIIPKPFDLRLIYEVPPTITKAAIATRVTQHPITDWRIYKGELMDRVEVGSRKIHLLQDRAKRAPERVVFAEDGQKEVLKVTQRIYEDGIDIPAFLGNKDVIRALKHEIGFTARVDVINPKSDAERTCRGRFIELYWRQRKRRGVTYEAADRLMRERNYFGTMFVETGQADAMIIGYSHAYPNAIRLVLEIVKKEEGVTRIAAASIMLSKQDPIFLSNATTSIDPSVADLADIALLTTKTVKFFGLEPSVAMLSYSNFGSATSENTLKVRETVAYLHKHYPDLVVGDEIQANFALNPDKIAKTYPFSKLNNGKRASALVFSNLGTANTSYELLKETQHLDTIDPLIAGLTRPIHITTIGSTIDGMVNLATLAMIEAQGK